MKRKIYYLLFFLVTMYAFSQEKKGIVFYGQKESMGMGSDIGHDYNAVLIFNQNKSLYITRNDSIEGGRVKENIRIKNKKQTFNITKSTNKYGFRYFFDLSKDSLFSRDIGFRYVQEKIPQISWKITRDKKKIGKFDCSKATSTFRGRHYTAWFTTQIPFRFGPWKLQGLPGVILEAYDTKKEVYFYFKKLTYPSNTKIVINKPTIQPRQKGGKWIGFQDYKNFLITAYLNSIENARVLAENFDNSSLNINQKYSLKGSYIENFKISDIYGKKK